MSTYYYSPSLAGFFTSDVNRVIPEDAKEITFEYWRSLLDGQGIGKKISHDESGYPILIDHPEVVLTYDQARVHEYPNVGEQLDMIWHSIDQGALDKTSSFYTIIAEIKSKYPKG